MWVNLSCHCANTTHLTHGDEEPFEMTTGLTNHVLLQITLVVCVKVGGRGREGGREEEREGGREEEREGGREGGRERGRKKGEEREGGREGGRGEREGGEREEGKEE
jgi:hypothetical protein